MFNLLSRKEPGFTGAKVGVAGRFSICFLQIAGGVDKRDLGIRL